MRVKTGSHTYLIAIPLILLLVVSLLFFASAYPHAAADDTVYLEADVTVGDELLPSSVLYLGSAYDFGFRLYGSTNKSYWTKVEDASALDNFELLYYSASDPDTAILQPDSVGSYIVRVTAKDVLSGYKDNAESPRLISEGVVVGEKRFSIVNEDLSLFCDPLDRASSLVLDDIHPNYYSAVISGTSLLLKGR